MKKVERRNQSSFSKVIEYLLIQHGMSGVQFHISNKIDYFIMQGIESNAFEIEETRICIQKSRLQMLIPLLQDHVSLNILNFIVFHFL